MAFSIDAGGNEKILDCAISGAERGNSENNLIGISFCDANNGSHYKITSVETSSAIKVVE